MKTYQGGGGAKHEEDSWESPSHHSSVHPQTSGTNCSQPFTPTEWVHSPFQPLRPAEGNPWEHILSTSTALSDTRSVHAESTSKRKEAEKFESAQWPQASRVKPVLATNSCVSSMPSAVPPESPCTSSRAADFHKQNERYEAKRWKHVQSLSNTSKFDSKIGSCRTSNWAKTLVLWITRFTRQQWICPIIQWKWRRRFRLWSFFVDRATGYANQRNQLPQTHPSAKKDRSTSPTGKGQGKESEQEKVTVAVVNIANHRPRTTSEKLLQFETSMTSHLKAERNLEQIRRSRMPMKCVIAFESVLPSEKKSINFSCQSLERAKFRDTIPSLSAIQTGGENGRSSNAPPTKVHKTKLLQKVCPCKGEECRDRHGDTFQRKDVHRRQWRFVTYDGIIFSESQRKEDYSTFKQQIWIFRSPMTLWSQTHTRRSTSMNLALLYGYMWWKILRQCYRWEDHAINLVIFRGRQEELPELRLHGCSSQTEGSTIHWILDSQGTPWSRTRSGGHHAGSAATIYRRTGRTRCLLLNPDSWEWPYAWSCRRTISWWETVLGCHRCGERHSGRRYQE